MTTVVYDGTFEGLLSAVFDIYEQKLEVLQIKSVHQYNHAIFGQHYEAFYDEHKAARVWKGLAAKLSAVALKQLYKTFLSEDKQMETMLLEYVRYAFRSKNSIESDYSHPAVLYVKQTAKKVDREKHRMEAFTRFQLTADGLYYAACQPDFNVLPLIAKHFKERYADQRWLIYDTRRKYGIYYNLEAVEDVQLTFNEQTANGTNLAFIMDEKETLYQQLWQQYFTSVNIAARKNTKLHIQHMPKRYWKFLTEKQVRVTR